MKNAHFPVMKPKDHSKDHKGEATCAAKKTQTPKFPKQQEKNKLS